MLYLESSALVKLVIAEDESQALRIYLAEHATLRRTTSLLARVEVPRAVAEHGVVAIREAKALLARLVRVPMTGTVLDEAASLGPPVLRSLHAIHLASALRLGDELTAFVGYDRRLLDVAAALRLPVASPS